MNFSASLSATISPRSTTWKSWPPKAVADWTSSIVTSLSWKFSASESTRTLYVTQWSTALHYGLALQHHVCLSWMLFNLKLSTLVESPMTRLKPNVCFFHITSRSVVSVFDHLFPDIASSVLSVIPLLQLLLPITAAPGCTCYSSKLLLVKLPKSRLTAHVDSFVPRFSSLWNHLPETVLSYSSLQQTVQCHLLSSPILTINPF